jgi:chromosome segregation ATPase
MQTSSILLEQKRAELQVKLTILKENLSNLKNQLDSTANLSFINTQYKSGNDLAALRQQQKTSLENELKKETQTLSGLRVYCRNLQNEKENSESETNYYHNKIATLHQELTKLQNVYEEARNRKLLLQQEVELLQNENANYNRMRFSNDKLHQTSLNQQEYISNEINQNSKKINVLQIKTDQLNQELRNLENNLQEIRAANNETEEYNEEMTTRILALGENAKAYDNKLYLLQREIDETKDYISSSTIEQKKLGEQLNLLTDLMNKINQKNIRINASLVIMMKSLEKRAEFMQREQEYYDECEEVKKKFVDELKEVDSYKDLI